MAPCVAASPSIRAQYSQGLPPRLLLNSGSPPFSTAATWVETANRRGGAAFIIPAAVVYAPVIIALQRRPAVKGGLPELQQLGLSAALAVHLGTPGWHGGTAACTPGQ